MNDNTIAVEGLVDLFKSLGKNYFQVEKNLAKNVLKKPGESLDIGY